MSKLGKIARRTFLIGAAAIAGGVAVGYYYYQRDPKNPLLKRLAAGEATFNPFIKLAEDTSITIYTGRSEMGQGVSTPLAAFVAEELGVSLAQINRGARSCIFGISQHRDAGRANHGAPV